MGKNERKSTTDWNWGKRFGGEGRAVSLQGERWAKGILRPLW